MSFLFLPSDFSPLTTLVIYVPVGSRNDPCDRKGLAHFAEHMFFRKISRDLSAVPCALNAKTTEDFTRGHIQCLSDSLQQILRKIQEEIKRRTWDDSDFRKEKDAIEVEYREIQTRPYQSTLERLYAEIFQKTPYAHPAIGSWESIQNIVPGDVVSFLNCHYRPANMIVSLCGPPYLRASRDFLDKIPNAPYQIPIQEMSWDNPELRGILIRHDIPPKRRPHQYVGFLVPGKNHPDIYSLRLISALLRERQECGKAAAIPPFYSHRLEEKQARSLFAFFLSYPKPQEAASVRDRLFSEIETLRAKGASAKEWAQAHARLTLDWISEMESALHRLFFLTEPRAAVLRPGRMSRNTCRIARPDPEALRDSLNRYFQLERAVIVEAGES